MNSKAVRKTMSEVGPMTSREITALFPDETQADIASVVSKMTKAVKKTVYIHSWTREPIGGREYLRAVYAVGNYRDTKKPPALTERERSTRRRAKARVPVEHTRLVNSIFNLGATL